MEWVEAIALDEVAERRPTRVMVQGVNVLVLRVGDHVFALENACTHQGAQLDKGVVKIVGGLRTVTCPAHGSVFNLETGRVIRPPATKAVAVYDVKIEEGQILLRRRE
jgi:nitrite reductase/ring-hydroxylating ferredoxin subunit